jgi:hypothetical protein
MVGTFALHPDMISNENVLERTWIYIQHISTQFSHQFIVTNENSSNSSSSHLIFSNENGVPTGVTFSALSLSDIVMYIILLVGFASSSVYSIGGRFLFIILCSYCLLFHSLSNLDLTTELTFGVHARFWMQPNIIAFIFIGIGFYTVLHYLTKCLHLLSTQISRWCCCCFFKANAGGIASSTTSSWSIVLMALVITSMRTKLNNNWSGIDQSKNYILENEIKNTMLRLPRNALVLLRGDHITNVMRYVQTCLHIRTDLSIMSDQLVKARWFVKQENQYQNIIFPKRRYVLDEIFGFSLEELIRLNILKVPVVACDRLKTVCCTFFVLLLFFF